MNERINEKMQAVHEDITGWLRKLPIVAVDTSDQKVSLRGLEISEHIVRQIGKVDFHVIDLVFMGSVLVQLNIRDSVEFGLSYALYEEEQLDFNEENLWKAIVASQLIDCMLEEEG